MERKKKLGGERASIESRLEKAKSELQSLRLTLGDPAKAETELSELNKAKAGETEQNRTDRTSRAFRAEGRFDRTDR